VDVWTTEQLVQMLHQRIDALFGQDPHDTCERLKSMGTCAVLGAVRHLAGDDCRAQGPFGPMIRRLDPRVGQEAEHGAPVTMPAQFIEQPLMVGIFQTRLWPFKNQPFAD
jgi:hypothetical protein